MPEPSDPLIEAPVIPVNCERCYSDDIHRIPKVRIFVAGAGIILTYALMSGREGTLILFFAILSLALVLLFLDRWRCRECGHTWSGEA